MVGGERIYIFTFSSRSKITTDLVAYSNTLITSVLLSINLNDDYTGMCGRGT